MKIVVYILCYDDATLEIAEERFGAFNWAIIIVIPSSPFLENCMYTEILESREHEWMGCDFVGTLSWKAPDKIIIPDMNVLGRYLEVNPLDVVALCFNNLNMTLTCQAVLTHNAFESIWTGLLSQLDIDADTVDKTVKPFYCNYWLATPVWMRRYIAFFKKAKHVLETYEPIQETLWSDSQYALASLTPERCMLVFGRPYYPYHPFICERLPSVFFTLHGANIKYYTQETTGIIRRHRARIRFG